MNEANPINDREGAAGEESVRPSPQVDLSAMLNKVLSNPQILTTVASALSSSGSKVGDTGGISDQQGAEPEREERREAELQPDVAAMASKLPEIMNILGPINSQGSGGKHAAYESDKRVCLLNAMKPYMSRQRCEAIDYIIKFSQISEILKRIT